MPKEIDAMDLVYVALELIKPRPGRPKQAILRRAMSSVYYALFHCLAASNANALVGGPSSKRSDGAWTQVYRALNHTTARKRCSNQQLMKRFPCVVQEYADMFCARQIDRHEADYDPNRQFVRDDVKWAVIEALAAIIEFRKVETRYRRSFAVYLLLEMRK